MIFLLLELQGETREVYLLCFRTFAVLMRILKRRSVPHWHIGSQFRREVTEPLYRNFFSALVTRESAYYAPRSAESQHHCGLNKRGFFCCYM